MRLVPQSSQSASYLFWQVRNAQLQLLSALSSHHPGGTHLTCTHNQKKGRYARQQNILRDNEGNHGYFPCLSTRVRGGHRLAMQVWERSTIQLYVTLTTLIKRLMRMEVHKFVCVLAITQIIAGKKGTETSACQIILPPMYALCICAFWQPLRLTGNEVLVWLDCICQLAQCHSKLLTAT